MFHVFHGATADEVWCQVADTFRDASATRRQASRAGETREILRAAITIENPRDRWVLSRSVPINPAFAIAEVIWIIAGRNDAEFLWYFNRRLPRFSGFDPQFHGAYGHRLRTHHGIDQLSRAYETLSSNADSRQVVLQIWDVASDVPRANGDAAAPDIPCNVTAMLKVRDNRLEWTQIVRSNDAYLGLPYNLVQFTTLQELIAGWLNLDVGEYAQISDSLHVYEDSFDAVTRSEKLKHVGNTDRLRMNKAESENAFKLLAQLVDTIVAESLRPEELRSLANDAQLPDSLRNMLRVLCAESARRRKSHDIMHEVMESCTNPVYRQLFDRWFERVSRPRLRDQLAVT